MFHGLERVVRSTGLVDPAMNISVRSGADARPDRPECFEYVGGGLDQGRAVADELVATLGARIERRAGHGHHLAAGFRSQARGDQRT